MEEAWKGSGNDGERKTSLPSSRTLLAASLIMLGRKNFQSVGNKSRNLQDKSDEFY
jgi:hypothetical protein